MHCFNFLYKFYTTLNILMKGRKDGRNTRSYLRVSRFVFLRIKYTFVFVYKIYLLSRKLPLPTPKWKEQIDTISIFSTYDCHMERLNGQWMHRVKCCKWCKILPALPLYTARQRLIACRKHSSPKSYRQLADYTTNQFSYVRINISVRLKHMPASSCLKA